MFMTLSKNGYSYIFPYSDVYWKKLVVEVKEGKCYKNCEEKDEMQFINEMLINDIESADNELPSFSELLWFLEFNDIFENGIIGVIWREMLFDETYFFNSEKRINDFLFIVIYTGIFDNENEKRKWKVFLVAFHLLKIYHLTKGNKLYEIKKDFSKIKDFLKICDNGLINGYDVGKKYLAKCGSVLHDMLPKSPEYKKVTIPSINIEDEEIFLIEYFLKSKPVIIKGYVNKWSAFKKWNHKFFYQSFYHRFIPVEYGESYTSSDYHSKVITFGEYLTTTNNTGYLAQHDIFHQIPKLKEDIMITSLIFCDSTILQYDDIEMNIFLGKPESYSPLHQDPRNNFFCQVNGTKFVRLVSDKYDHKKELYCFGDDTTNKNSSQANVFNIDKKLYPAITEVVFEDYLMSPGDCLFIPKGYFHSMYGITNNISLSQWFGDKLF